MRQQSDVGLGNEATIFSYTGLEEFFFNSTGLSVGSQFHMIFHRFFFNVYNINKYLSACDGAYSEVEFEFGFNHHLA